MPPILARAWTILQCVRGGCAGVRRSSFTSTGTSRRRLRQFFSTFFPPGGGQPNCPSFFPLQYHTASRTSCRHRSLYHPFCMLRPPPPHQALFSTKCLTWRAGGPKLNAWKSAPLPAPSLCILHSDSGEPSTVVTSRYCRYPHLLTGMVRRQSPCPCQKPHPVAALGDGLGLTAPVLGCRKLPGRFIRNCAFIFKEKNPPWHRKNSRLPSCCIASAFKQDGSLTTRIEFKAVAVLVLVAWKTCVQRPTADRGRGGWAWTQR